MSLMKFALFRLLIIAISFTPCLLAQQASMQAPVVTKKSTQQSVEEEAQQDLPCPLGRNLTEEVKYRDYTLRTYLYPNPDGCLRISKRGDLVYSASGGQFQIGRNPSKDDRIPVGTDLLGNGMPTALVTEWTGGAHCCFIFIVFQLGEHLKQIAMIEAGHSGGKFIDLDHDGAYEFVGNDWTFAYWRAPFAFSPAPRIVLKYKDGRYSLAYDSMRKPAPNPGQFAVLVRDIKNDDEWTDAPAPNCDMNCGVPVALWRIMLELIYTGHVDLAWRFFEESWRSSRSDKASFANDFCQQLSKSQYWPDLEKEVGSCPPPKFRPLKK